MTALILAAALAVPPDAPPVIPPDAPPVLTETVAASPSKTPRAAFLPALRVTVADQGCGPCDRWEREAVPALQEAGWVAGKDYEIVRVPYGSAVTPAFTFRGRAFCPDGYAGWDQWRAGLSAAMGPAVKIEARGLDRAAGTAARVSGGTVPAPVASASDLSKTYKSPPNVPPGGWYPHPPVASGGYYTGPLPAVEPGAVVTSVDGRPVAPNYVETRPQPFVIPKPNSFQVGPAVAPGTHSHRCEACGFVWTHPDGSSFRGAHNCPNCGRVETEIYQDGYGSPYSRYQARPMRSVSGVAGGVRSAVGGLLSIPGAILGGLLGGGG